MKAAVNAPDHLAVRLNWVFNRFAGEVLPRVATFWPGVEPPRPSALRVLENVPASGIRLTDLAEQLAMTKQGAGQVIQPLLTSGLMSQEPDPDDGRARILRLTPEGRRLRNRVTRVIAATEAEFARQVGAERYATFLAVAADLAATQRSAAAD